MVWGVFNYFILSLLSRNIAFTCLPSKMASSYAPRVELHRLWVFVLVLMFLAIPTPEPFVSLSGPPDCPWGALVTGIFPAVFQAQPAEILQGGWNSKKDPHVHTHTGAWMHNCSILRGHHGTCVLFTPAGKPLSPF